MSDLGFQSFESVPDAVIVISRDGRIAFANERAARLFGYAPDKLVGLALEALLPERYRERNSGFLEEFFGSPTARPTGTGREFGAVKQNGHEFPAQIAIGPLPGGEHVVTTVRDISETVRIREELRAGEERFRIISENTENTLFGVDVDNDRLIWFDDVDATTGYEPGGFPRTLTGWFQQLHPDDIARVTNVYSQILQQGRKTWDFPVRIRVKDGSYRHCIDRGTVTEFVDGRPSKGIGVVIDETAAVEARQELERAVAELREGEQRFRIAVSQVADVVQHVNLQDDRYVWFGDVDALTGYDPGEFPRSVTGWLDLIHPDDVDRINAEIERIVEKGDPHWNFRYRIRTQDGSYQHWLDRGTVTTFVNGQPNEGIGAIIDETEQVAARQELEHALNELESLKDRLQAEGQYLMEEIKNDHNFHGITGNSAALRSVLEKVEQVAETDAVVLLHGETGTGKELLARSIHARSRRNSRPLIKLDCSTLPAGLIESELFGHEKGAFTGAHEQKIGRFELADGGTILLDEIGELPLELQPKLLRVIQEGEFQRLGGNKMKTVDVRVVAATNRDLRKEMRAGRFRADLYYRLSVFPIELPPLRQRREDIPELASLLVRQRSKTLGKNVDRIPRTTMDALVAYDWPGNVRELQNVIERSLILSPGRDLVLAEALGEHTESRVRESGVLKLDLASIERRQIVDALQESHWRIKGEGNAASRLGLKPSTLRSRMKRLGIARP